MKIKILGSGSNGNCLVLEKNNRKLIVDCGLKKKDILIGVDFNISNIDACIVSHEHSDHKRALKDIENLCIKTFTPFTEDNVNNQILFKSYNNWNIYSFPLPHENTKNYGFLIENEGEKVIYLVDFEYCRYNFKTEEITHFLIECNYREEYINEEMPNFKHKVLGHCEYNTCIKFLRANITDKAKNITLLHTGEGIGDKRQLLDDLKAEINNSNIYYDIAVKGLEYEI